MGKFNSKISGYVSERWHLSDTDDLDRMTDDELLQLSYEVRDQIQTDELMDLSIKAVNNSMYGGSTHKACRFYNIDVGADITAEGRNATHSMEKLLTDFWCSKWKDRTDLHQQFSITVDPAKCDELLRAPVKQTDINPILVYGDTDSLYSSFENILPTINGSDKWTNAETLDFIVSFNQQFLDGYNKKWLADYYASRHAKSVHDFELETVSLRSINLMKKKYMLLLAWKDGDNMLGHEKMKYKGIELVQSGTSKFARKFIADVVATLMHGGTERDCRRMLIDARNRFMDVKKTDIYQICGVRNLNPAKYAEYVIDEASLTLGKQCPMTVQAAARYNAYLINNGLASEPLKMGKVQYYYSYGTSRYHNKSAKCSYFGFPYGECPDWAGGYMPIDRPTQFEKTIVEPLSRIFECIKYNVSTAAEQLSMF